MTEQEYQITFKGECPVRFERLWCSMQKIPCVGLGNPGCPAKKSPNCSDCDLNDNCSKTIVTSWTCEDGRAIEYCSLYKPKRPCSKCNNIGCDDCNENYNNFEPKEQP